MGAGERDVAAHSAAHEGGDDEEVDLLGQERILQGLADRRLGDDGNVEHEQDHDGAERGDETVESHARALGQEDEHGDGCGDDAAPARVDAEHRVDAQARAGDIADVEDEDRR